MTLTPTARRRPINPCALDPRPGRTATIQLEGVRDRALETGRTRLVLAGMVFALGFLTLGARLIDLAVLTDGYEPRLSRDGGTQELATGRADIVDRNGVVLATTLPTASLYANPREIRDRVEAARRLSKVLGDYSPAAIEAKLASDGSFAWIKRNLTPREQYAVNRLGIPGLYFQREERRYYPAGALTSHVLGFTDLDNKGLAGIEQSFEPLLSGGHTPLQLSLDLRIQHILSEELAASMAEFEAKAAAGIVLDIESGEVLAMVSLPSFDPHEAGSASDEARFNHATLGIYELGSVFKIFTTALALDEGVVDFDDGYDVSKPIKVSRFTINDYKPKKPYLTVPEVFMYSSNIGTVKMALETGTEAQRSFLDRLGLLRPATFELPEIGQPLVPAPWREINTMTVAYGHGLAVSPLMMARAASAVIGDGVLKPVTLIKRDPRERVIGERVMSARASEQMRQLMRLTVEAGTGRSADVPGYLVGGKTGTADKQRGRGYARNARLSSFLGAFPMDAPRYLVFAMLDEPHGNAKTHGYATGGWVAAPMVGRVVARLAPLVGVPPVAPSEDLGESPLLVKIKTSEGRRLASN